MLEMFRNFVHRRLCKLEPHHNCTHKQPKTSIPIRMLGIFSYEGRLPPDHIRLLTVSAGEAASTIQCNLLAFRLSDVDSSYVALSYAWGERPPDREIVCNGVNLKITESLYAALWQYCENKDDKLLWADAICINQTDADEKTEQVRMMRTIYSQAFQVLLLLGPSEEHDAEAVDLLHQIASTEIVDDFTSGVLDCVRYGLPPLSEPIWDVTLSLLKRSWFERAWVIQEMAVNSSATFRKGSIDVDILVLLKASKVGSFYNMHAAGQSIRANNHDSHTTDPNPIKGPLLEEFRVRIQERHATPLHELLMMSRLFKTSEPKDKIFALARLAEDWSPDFVNYRKSLDETIIEVARQAISHVQHNSQSMLSVIGLLSCVYPSPKTENLPSWAVDFSGPQQWSFPVVRSDNL